MIFVNGIIISIVLCKYFTMLFEKYSSMTKIIPTIYSELITAPSSPRPMYGFSTPLHQLSVILGLLKVKLFGREPTTLYSYLIHVPLAIALVMYKIDYIIYDMNKSRYGNMQYIILFLIVVYGFLDLIVIQSHLYELNKSGSQFMDRLNEIRVTSYPRLYSRYLTVFGIGYYFLTMTLLRLLTNWSVTAAILLFAYTSCTYIIIMQFCTFLELLEVSGGLIKLKETMEKFGILFLV